MGPRNGVALVIPTLGTRRETLDRAIQSARNQVEHLSIVCPESALGMISRTYGNVADQIVLDSEHNLPAAINLAMDALPDRISLISWLGDDDFLTEGSVESAIRCFDSSTSFVFGHCLYVSPDNRIVFNSRFGWLAKALLRTGPNLVPQPGSLIARGDFTLIGGLDESFSLAFDYDLVIRLSEIGRIKSISRPLAFFGWHPGSLSVSQRDRSLDEAQKVRVKNAKTPALRLFAHLGLASNLAVQLAAYLVDRRAKAIR